jgi:hypothetical protein
MEHGTGVNFHGNALYLKLCQVALQKADVLWVADGRDTLPMMRISSFVWYL